MKVLGVLMAVLTVLSAGLGVTLALWRRSSAIMAEELFAWSWLLGAGVVSMLLALGGTVLSGVALVAVVTIIALAGGVYGGMRLRRGVCVETGLAGAAGWEKWVSLLALVPVGYFAWATFRDAMVWDGLFIWEAKARHAFLAGGSLPASYFTDATRVRFHPIYPLYLPFTELWVYLWAGDCDQTAVKTIFVIFYAAAMALLWTSVKRFTGRPWIATVTALLPLFVPYMADHGLGLVQGYADFILGTVYFAGVSALLAWRIKGEEGAWPIAVACAALLPWIKQEWQILLPSLGVLALLAAAKDGWRAWKRMLLFAAPAVVVVVGWALALRMLNVTEESTFLPKTVQNLVAGLPRLGTIFSRMGHHFALLKNWSVLWFVVPAALLSLACRRRREAPWLALALLVPLVLDLLPFIFTNIDLVFHITTSVDRLYLQISLVAVLVLGLALEGGAPPPRKSLEADVPKEE
jgi:hypothetical protein